MDRAGVAEVTSRLLLIVSAAVFGALFLVPVGMLFVEGMSSAVSFRWWDDSFLWRVVGFTYGQALLSAALSALVGFALIWHMWLIAGVAFATMLVAVIVHTFNYKRDFHIPADEVVRVEGIRTRMLAGHV